MSDAVRGLRRGGARTAPQLRAAPDVPAPPPLHRHPRYCLFSVSAKLLYPEPFSVPVTEVPERVPEKFRGWYPAAVQVMETDGCAYVPDTVSASALDDVDTLPLPVIVPAVSARVNVKVVPPAVPVHPPDMLGGGGGGGGSVGESPPHATVLVSENRRTRAGK